MPVNLARVRQCLQNFDFRTLFIQELGWDRPAGGLSVVVDGRTFALQTIAEKRGFQVFECPAAGDGALPDHATRGKIERQAAKLAHEHIIVYTDAARIVQKWQWVRRELGRPLARREYDFAKGRTGEALAQKLQALAVELAEEESLTLTDVTRRARQALDVERVTRRFYDRFQAEHAAFLAFLKGIPADGDAEWYASLMLNRLMFIYFIQQKRFLADDPDYLRNRLQRVRAMKGKDKFLTFYRHFLRRLFHEGLGQQPRQRKKDLDELLGDVPYLNGGLFDVHELERTYPDIQIADDAFARLFDFFDAYRWHLDERPLREESEINPDVLGYIFEKYINQKQMGAYYTKEDITGYIARNTILPFLCNAAAQQCAVAFQPGSALWRLLSDDPDRYLYAAVRHGVDLPLPAAVEAGVSDVAKRRGWNTPAAPQYGLPTETWREHIARRQRCHDLRAKMKAGAIHDINDLITYNLDICQFVEDVIENSEGPELLRAVYQALEKATVLDPTCGSGAFLFAALNILDPLYEACLDRMTGFLEDMRRLGSPRRLDHFGDFHQVLQEVARHPNRRYFILKSIIVNNLYGVDIMEEAVEVCKLRLFLKLAAQVESVQQIEPLPDIDFNIRAGNTLVGFASLAELERLRQSRLTFDAEEFAAILNQAKEVELAFAAFRRVQLEFGAAVDCSEAKTGLQKKLTALRDKLDRYLAGEYGVDPDKPKDFQKWRDSHEPFHWLAEFYGIMNGGGFDVIIGNPPYVEYHTIRGDYQIQGYQTLACGNLYAYVLERCMALSFAGTRVGMIVQLSAICTDRMLPLQERYLASANTIWASCYDDRPGKLFDGLEHIRATIILSAQGTSKAAAVQTTNLMRWHTEARSWLFASLSYGPVSGLTISGSFPKIGDSRLRRIVERIRVLPLTLESAYRPRSPELIHYYRSPLYWIRAQNFQSQFESATATRSVHHFKDFPLSHKRWKHIAGAIINSNLFYLWFVLYGNGRNLAIRDIITFPIPKSLENENAPTEFMKVFQSLMDDFQKHSVVKQRRDGIRYQEFCPGKSKPFMDEIDCILAKHYGFTAEELDFILNYDIKYRMGQDAEDNGEE
jgi:hypothetical protein